MTEDSIPAHPSGKDHSFKITGRISMLRFALLSAPNCGYEEDSLKGEKKKKNSKGNVCWSK
jgi:hypothetical protein